ncbi:hypothetical protein STEG23_004629 [Scotinomys teguina]
MQHLPHSRGDETVSFSGVLLPRQLHSLLYKSVKNLESLDSNLYLQCMQLMLCLLMDIRHLYQQSIRVLGQKPNRVKKDKLQNAEERCKVSEFCDHDHLLFFIFCESSSSTDATDDDGYDG